MSIDVHDPATVLAAAETSVRTRRAAALEDLDLVLAWADLHGDDPQHKPGAIPVRYGGDQLIDLGGDGTPYVQDLCLGELAIARHTHLLSTRSVMADALDLRHRLPQTWAIVQTLACEVWVACRVASMTRKLTHAQVALVDEAVARAIGGCAPGRVFRIVEAKIIEADTAAHIARIEEQGRTRTVVLSPTDDTGLRMLFARLEAGDAVWVDATIDRVADLLHDDADLRALHHPDLPEDVTKAELRAIALGWLARPHDLAALLHLLDQHDDEQASKRRKPSAVLHVHFHQAALDTGVGVARVEELGPLVLDQVRLLLAHANVTLRPVLDLSETIAVDRYEHPTIVRERTAILIPADAFPHSTSVTRRVDLDHPTPYLDPDSGGPPGQTGDHAAAPLTRRHHRAKTHAGYTVEQLDRTTFEWTTPHGVKRRVDPTGTHPA
ncbi:hypothetical protein [Nocardioides lianchengensis]|uniref:DUF222 domain-containing protein n=1 Tax=Nocardioides lianchengensis TaxID=1045774 RepID=A0A1G6VAW6_9ACTN|nr:hypothetical protein [Nocardioides lianchengensis]NYG11215.1 hypothetical protein [Nocardioides lianchengensis]SDD50799.1 hypothetical protein SAMN05421872_108267 [Nocardioides lianchengensis]